MLKRNVLRLAVVIGIGGLAACATVPQPVTVADTIARTPELSTLSSLIAKAGLTETLRGTGPYTVFAPSNEAFKAVAPAVLAKLGDDPAALKGVLLFHVLPAKVPAAEVAIGSVKSVQGAPLALAKAGTFVTVEDAVVQTADVAATNGVIHVIDRVLMPPKR
jgi:uncharacterized surface protein with fasciclin (FAS1) repeats